MEIKNEYSNVVGIGASAGGLASFEAFFSGMPSNTKLNMVFVIVQHLAPEHKSILSSIIQQYTKMIVAEVTENTPLKNNCVYIIPPNKDMILEDGILKLIEAFEPHGRSLPIDLFFESLARDQGKKSIAIVLSGNGSDGSQGIKSIKESGGMVIIQTPSSTQFKGMSQNAIETGFFDYELLPSEMVAQLIIHSKHPLGMHIINENSKNEKNKNILKEIFSFLRQTTGNDFSQYKPSTIYRRIERRMTLHQIKTIESYSKFLQQTPSEIYALFHELLIGVTSLFRDDEAFKILKERIKAKLIVHKSNDVFRIWSAGCSTGEEAYTIAILVRECLDELKQNISVQIFATDIDSYAIGKARLGKYPYSIANQIPNHILEKYFAVDLENKIIKVNKNIRDMIIFSEQNIIQDPPFSKIDLISCRNLLIYMSVALQKKLIPMFHYALNNNGLLFLGTSETINEFSDLFSTIDQKSKIYQRKETLQQHKAININKISSLNTSSSCEQLPKNQAVSIKTRLKEIMQSAMIKHISFVAALINEDGDILYLHGRTGFFLELPSGETATNNIIKMAKDDIKQELIDGLRKAISTKEIVTFNNLKIKSNDQITSIILTIRPILEQTATKLDTNLYLVVFEKIAHQTKQNNYNVEDIDLDDKDLSKLKINKYVAVLKKELETQEAYLQAANEKLESSNEELKSYNEEMQSLNEELQSANEELETSKEELQSVNEELLVVNSQLQTKVLELSRSNNDMNNLLAGTGIGTIFVDYGLCILRFTPASTNIINLILSDLGRPIGHIVSNLINYDNLVDDIKLVLNTLNPIEKDLQTVDKKWYSMRINPYRTLNNVVEGAVISFIDISEIVGMRESLQKSNTRIVDEK